MVENVFLFAACFPGTYGPGCSQVFCCSPLLQLNDKCGNFKEIQSTLF